MLFAKCAGHWETQNDPEADLKDWEFEHEAKTT
jgi:hypothetical protein